MNTFIKNEEILEEGTSNEDFLDLSFQINGFSKKIDAIEKSGLIGLVADFGRGKSTLIDQVRKKRNLEKKELWINFDAWKLPERKELWEGFILELAKQISPDIFNKAKNQIDGKSSDDKRALLNTISDIPGFAVLKNLNHFLKTSPARRVFEMQEILKDLILNKIKEREVFIVVEDVDRSGQNGIYFIETLKQFIKDSNINKKIIVIVPISEKSFIDFQEAYLKCLDFIEFLDFSSLDLKNFFNQVIAENVDYREDSIDLLNNFFIFLSKNFPDTTLRKIKLIFRKASLSYKLQVRDNLNPDWKVTILFESMKFFKKEQSTYFDLFKERGAVIRDNVFATYLYGVFLLINNGYRNLFREKTLTQPPSDFEFSKRVRQDENNYPSTPYSVINRYDNGKKFYIVDFYMRY